MNDLTPFFSEEELERYNELKKEIEKEKKERKKEIKTKWKKEHKDYFLNWRKNNKERIKKYYSDSVKWYNDFKEKINVCEKCRNVFEPCCIEFHHLSYCDGKEECLGNLCNKKPEFIKEARKCVQLCANCHRLITFGIISDEELDNSWLQQQLDELEALDC